MLVTSTTNVDHHLSYVDITSPQSSVMCGTSTCETSGNNNVPVGVGAAPLDTLAPAYHHVWAVGKLMRREGEKKGKGVRAGRGSRQ